MKTLGSKLPLASKLTTVEMLDKDHFDKIRYIFATHQRLIMRKADLSPTLASF